MTLEEARNALRELVEEGYKCPCCTQQAKVYRRKCHATMAATAIKLWRAGGGTEFVHTPSLPGDTHEASQLSWWGLAEEELTHREDGGRAGYWRLTALGIAWVTRQTTIPKYARVYDGRCLGLTGKAVSIEDALASKFHYRELMSGV